MDATTTAVLDRVETARSLPDLLRTNAREHPDRPALRRRVGDDWEVITWRAYAEQVDRIGAGLLALGLRPGERVGILSGNRPEWHIADLAIMTAGGVTVPCYPTSSSSQIGYLLGHSEARLVFVEDAEQLAKVLLRRHELPALERVVLFGGGAGLDEAFVVELDRFAEEGDLHAARSPGALDERRVSLRRDDLATLVYTSGTTGPPKGAMLSHANVLFTIGAVLRVVPAGPDDRFLSFLPLSHIAERTVSHFAQLAIGGETWFARSLATVPDDLQACRPTLFFAVPRVWEKLMDAITGKVAAGSAPVRALLEQYLALGNRAMAAADGLSAVERVEHAVLDHTLGRSVRRNLGLDQARILVSGAAPIHPDRLRWFAALGLHVCEVWGQTEDCGPATLNPPDAIRIGTVGPALPGLELRIAEDGEILVRGGSVCLGYFKDTAATEKLISPDGWMATGDLGTLDEDGYLTIVGRKKDLIILSSGKNIAPQELESRLEMIPLVAKAVVVGEGRPYLVALLTLDGEAVAEWAHHRRQLGATEALAHDPELLDAIGRGVDEVNAGHARVEGIKRWRILPSEFTVASGEMTPTLKVKRNVVIERYADVIEELYA
jgi:long-chain acyl-CoA synthetase